MHCKIKYVEIAAFKQLWYFKKYAFCDSFRICLPESVENFHVVFDMQWFYFATARRKIWKICTKFSEKSN